MNVSLGFGNLSVRSACAAGFGLLGLLVALAAWPASGAGFDAFIVTDSKEPAGFENDEGSVVRSVKVDDEDEQAATHEEKDEVGGAYPKECDVGCTSCGGHGCKECRDSKGWINGILCNVEPRLVGQVDALMLWQGAIGSRSLYYDTTNGDKTVLDVNQAQTPVTVGSRYALFANLDCTYAIEGNYFNVTGFNGEQSTPYSDASYAMNNLAGLNYKDIEWARITTSGQIQSAELNWRRRTGTPVTWLAGFRWVEWNQTFKAYDLYSSDGSTGRDVVRNQTGNDLYGGQVGADVMLWNRWKEVTINGIGKAGVYYNDAYSRTQTPTEKGSPKYAAVADQTAFFGEVGANANVKLTCWLSWRLGYSVFWLSGVATPADQLSLAGQGGPKDSTTINTNGSVLLHGVTTGLEARW